MAEPAKIEFLTRAAGAVGFQTRHVESGEAQRLFRPRRLPESAWELTPQPRSPDGKQFVLRNRENDRYVLLDSRENFLWEHFDGEHTLGDTARLLHFTFGAFDYSIINQLLARLYTAGLLHESGAAGVQPSPGAAGARRLARALLRWRRLCTRISLKFPGADAYCAAIYRRGGFLLFNGFTLALCLALGAYALTAAYRLWPQAKELTLGVAAAPVLSTAAVILATVLVAILHVLVHALACKA